MQGLVFQVRYNFHLRQHGWICLDQSVSLSFLFISYLLLIHLGLNSCLDLASTKGHLAWRAGPFHGVRFYRFRSCLNHWRTGRSQHRWSRRRQPSWQYSPGKSAWALACQDNHYCLRRTFARFSQCDNQYKEWYLESSNLLVFGGFKFLLLQQQAFYLYRRQKDQ